MTNDTAPKHKLRARYLDARFLTDRPLRRVAHLAGVDLRFGPTRGSDTIAVWGQTPLSNGKSPVTRFDDAFLRGLHAGPSRTPLIGVNIDHHGAFYDARQPSDLENLLARHPFDDAPLLARARNAIERMKASHITKFSAIDPTLKPPEPGYVLVIDQPRGDASVTLGGASASTFREMLVFAQEEHPHTRIIIKSHPDTATGHYSDADTGRNISIENRPLSPWALLDGAIAVYTVSSQMGFEAILAGHKPQVFGQPFYAGWGLSVDRNPVDRRRRTLTKAQLFAGAMILYPKWYSPFTDTLCELEDILELLEVQARAWREDRQGYIGTGMRYWKRAAFQEMFGGITRMTFSEDITVPDRPVLVWSRAITDDLRRICSTHSQPLIQAEDGFLRSRGLGAAFTPPLSLALDTQGIYYDPRTPSDLEDLVAQSATYSAANQVRAKRLLDALLELGVTKYNLTGRAAPTPPKGARVILVPGQVADDASVLTGADLVKDNAALLAHTRAANPDAWIIYKPHPDVETGLRNGKIAGTEADFIATEADPLALLKISDEVWTMTSTLGFEALLRGVPVTTLGVPFYAGWGLTRDLGHIPERRQARPTLLQFVHATLIAYPRYYDAQTGLPCPPEVAVMRLAQGGKLRRAGANKTLVQLKSMLASWPTPWR